MKHQLNPQSRKLQTIFSGHSSTKLEIKYWNRKKVKQIILEIKVTLRNQNNASENRNTFDSFLCCGYISKKI